MSTRYSRPAQGPRSRFLLLLPLLLCTGTAAAQESPESARHYDARAAAAQSRALSADQFQAQSQASQRLSADVQELSALHRGLLEK